MFFQHFNIPKFQHSNAWFTLVELIIGMTIFAIGLTGIYALLSSTMGNASYSRHEIVAANLLREEIELVKNIRDTDIRNFLSWDKARIEWSATPGFHSGVFVVENNFQTPTLAIDTDGNIIASPVYMREVTSSFVSPVSLANRFEQSKLILDAEGRYVHARPGLSGSGTPYASYIIMTPIEFTDANGTVVTVQKDGKSQGYIIDARVIVNSRWIYREYDAKTMITDWIK